MELCSRCKKRVAVIFISKLDGDKSVNEGICIKCAKELGIKPVNDILNNMGLTDADLDRMDMEMEGLMSVDDDGDGEDGEENPTQTPPIDFKKIFGGFGIPMQMKQDSGAADGRENVKNGEKKSRKAEKQRKFLSEYCTDLTAKARDNALDRIVGRERELERLMQILCRRQKNNPCLIGEPGVGKTAIAEALAIRIAEGNVPFRLADKEVHLVDMTALVAGTQFRGQFEARIKGLIEEVKKLGNIILVIDEVHSIVGAGESEGSMNAANILKPALSRGQIQVIGATTLAEYRKYIEKDSALERRFQPIIVEENSVAQSIEILKGIKGYYENFHGITVTDEVINRTVLLSERYITDRFLPDKAIDLLDEACAHLALNSPQIQRAERAAKDLREKREALEKLESERAESEPTDDLYRALAEAKTAAAAAENELNEALEEKKGVRLTIDDLAYVIEVWTGIPASGITENEFLRVDKLAERMKTRIIGQNEAVDAVARAIKRNRAGVSYKKRPVSFIFAGPTGVGKTELVKTLASDLFDSPETLIRLDMSEYMEKHSVSRIIGAPPGYVGYDEAGQLTEKIRRKPYSVILFDEIEKAHPDVLNVLLQILDDGRVTDARGKQVNFENTVIVMTTNAGAVGVDSAVGFSTSAQSAQESKTEKALSSFLRPEFINRVDEIITFRSLEKDDFVKIAAIMLNDLKDALDEKGISLTFDEATTKYLADKAFSKKYGARNLRRVITKEVEDKIAEEIISSYGSGVASVSLTADENGLSIVCLKN